MALLASLRVCRSTLFVVKDFRMDIAAHLVLRTKTVVVTDFAVVGRRHVDTGLSLRNG
jgi:hypothetical protein